MENDKNIARSIRKASIKKNWAMFKQSKLGMIGLYIVAFFYSYLYCNPFYLLQVFGI